MRQRGILSLRWEHIDLQHGVAHLPVTKNCQRPDVPLSRRAARQHLKIEILHFHDLRHEAISRLFKQGTLNVMEVAAISEHKSLNMLKRYTHLRAYQRVSKLDARRRQSQKIATYFVPYPGEMEDTDEGFRGHLHDSEGLSGSGRTREAAMDAASVVLLRRLAMAAQHGERVPLPGDLPLHSGVMFNPLAGPVMKMRFQP